MSSSDHSADARHTDHGGTRHTIHIADEGFVFGPATVRDDDVTGGQVAEAAKKHPVEDYVILEHLRSGELESKRPNELTDVRSDDVHFFVIKNTGEKQDFFVDGLSMEWPRPAIEADQIVYLARAPENSEVVVHFGDGPAVIYEGSEEVRLDTPGVEKFTTRPATRTITITVDSEPFVPEARRMTPDDIISKATGQDPATTYLVFAPPGGPKESFQGKGETKIPLRDGMNFITVSTGPTTVSDAAFEKGLPLALRGLEALGYKPTVVSGTTHHVAFDYTVEAGRFAGRAFRLGLVIPTDFPLAWPSGPHVSPEVHPICPNGQHPTGGVHKEHSGQFQSAEGGQWQYWSRPYNPVGQWLEPVDAYMRHVARLWESQ